LGIPSESALLRIGISLGFAKLAFVEWRKVMRYEYLGDNLADYCRRMR
jgi:hypothetical protein